jgi:hypothetical protein
LTTPEVVNYNELKSYRARLVPSRVFDHRLSRIERLVLDAYIDMTTIDYVRKEDGKRIGLGQWAVRGHEGRHGACYHRKGHRGILAAQGSDDQRQERPGSQ